MPEESYAVETVPTVVSTDTDANMMYISFKEEEDTTRSARTVPVLANLDYDADGNLLGVEVLLPPKKN